MPLHRTNSRYPTCSLVSILSYLSVNFSYLQGNISTLHPLYISCPTPLQPKLASIHGTLHEHVTLLVTPSLHFTISYHKYYKMLNEQTFVAEAELSTVNKQSWILYAKKFLISCSCNRFCQYPVCARVPDYTYATFEEYARWDSLTSKLPWPQTQEEQIPVYQNVPRNMAAMIHNVLPVASVNTCGSDCTMQPVLCQTCSSECLSQLSGTMSQSDQPADMKFICQSQQSAAEIMKASQTVDGDNYLAPYSPHPAPCHFWLNPRLKLGFWVKVLWHLQTSNATQQPDSTPHKKMLSMCAAKHDKTTGKSVCASRT